MNLINLLYNKILYTIVFKQISPENEMHFRVIVQVD